MTTDTLMAVDTLEVGDAALAFRYTGGRSPALVFIHGAYLSAEAWRPQLGALRGRACLFVDLRGHGRSARTGYPYSVAQFAEDVKVLLRHLDLGPVVLCGHSLGGMVAQHLAAHAPHLVAKLVLADTSYGVRSSRFEALLTDAVLPLLNTVPIAWQAALFANQIGRYSADAKRYVRREISQHAQDPRNYRAVWRAVTQFSGQGALSRIGCPTLLMVGARNKQTHAQARVMAERIRTSDLIYVSDAGHMLNWDNAAGFNRALLEFAEG